MMNQIEWKDAANWIFGIITIFSTLLTFYYGRKAIKLEKKNRSLDFQDLLTAASEIRDAFHNAKFHPDFIVTPGLRGATFSNLIEDEFSINYIPVIVGISFLKGVEHKFDIKTEYTEINTNKWQMLFPTFLLKETAKKILIVDDFAMSGDFLCEFKKKLESAGWKSENIKTATIAVTHVAIQNKKSPDFYWYKTNDNNFYFPWGKAR